jgi:hypothetical protein
MVTSVASVVETYSCLANTGGGVEATICLLNVNAPAAVANITLFVLASLITDMLVVIFMIVFEPFDNLTLAGQIHRL